MEPDWKDSHSLYEIVCQSIDIGNKNQDRESEKFSQKKKFNALENEFSSKFQLKKNEFELIRKELDKERGSFERKTLLRLGKQKKKTPGKGH